MKNKQKNLKINGSHVPSCHSKKKYVKLIFHKQKPN